MPESLIPPALAVVILGLLASLGWGVGDFGGGLASRSAPVLGVLFLSQVASLVVGIPLLLFSGEPAASPQDLVIAGAGGILSATGLSLLYRGLSVGRMGVVAPLAAVLTAALPVGFGFLTEGMPSWVVIVGIAFAILSVVLVSRAPEGSGGRPSGVWYGLAAGAVFGLFTIAASQLADELIVTPVVVVRIASIATAGTWILVRRQPWRVPRRLWPALLAIGVIDMSATASYLSAIAVGPLAIASILAALYPVVTTILATLVLREHMSRVHAVGILTAGLAVALIAGASAT